MAGWDQWRGQAHHFRIFAPERFPYAIERYTKEVARLYGVLDGRLAERGYIAGIGWSKRWERQGQDITAFPHFRRWLDTVLARPAVQRGLDQNYVSLTRGALVKPARRLSETHSASVEDWGRWY